MYVELTDRLSGVGLEKWKSFLAESGLIPDTLITKTVIVWDGESIVATGSRYGNILKLIAIHPDHRGEDLTATVVSELRRDAFGEGHRSLFLYTKPENEHIFTGLFFYPVAKTDSILLLEDRRDGIKGFVERLPHEDGTATVGALVMNCDPFTLGHLYLIKRASLECDRVYAFVLSEDRGEFSTADRLEMVKLGTRELENVTVLETGPYLISNATFPTYFLKNRDSHAEAMCALDIEIFAEYFAKRLSVSKRYVGTEPLSPLTEKYNRELKRLLPARGVELVEVNRLECGEGAVSASAARRLIRDGKYDMLSAYLPKTTLDYLMKKGYIH